MRLSTDRILTTHVGSMPRPQPLVDALLRKDRGEAYDPAEHDRVIHEAVGAVVRRQAEAGVDVPSDGEASKVSYSTYMMDRLTGFGGDNARRVALDLLPYPAFREKMARMTGMQAFRRASCVGPVAVKDLQPLQARRRDRLQEAEGPGRGREDRVEEAVVRAGDMHSCVSPFA